MPEPFKNLFNKTIVISMSEHFAKAWPAFDRAGFVAAATDNLDALELKQRSDQIMAAMTTYLPEEFERAGEIMLASLTPEDGSDLSGATVSRNGIAGWATFPMTHYVGLHGLRHFELAMALLKQMTKRGSSEFGIRFFLLDQPKPTLRVLEQWSEDPCQHVRRLVSEGTRPRLPWARRLPAFINNPTPILPLLEALKDDGEEYVRRSVANNLNDIAKDHPNVVAEIAKRWLQGASRERTRLISHACRTLLKQGHQHTLKSLGYDPPKVKLGRLAVVTPTVSFGTALEFALSLTSIAGHAQRLMIDYVIHHRKANGSTTPKVFKWKNLTLSAHQALTVKRSHPMKSITTRVYYAGDHRVEVVVNGVSQGSVAFTLMM